MKITHLFKTNFILFTCVLFTAICTADIDPVVAESNEDITKIQLTLKLIEQMNTGQFDTVVKLFDAKMAKALSADELAAGWQQINSLAGKFEKVLDTSQKVSEENTTVYAASQFGHSVFDVKVTFNQENQIIGLFFSPSKYRPQKEVTVGSEQAIQFGDENWLLNGVVTYPKTGGGFPLVILVHGSGPSDMDLTVGPNKPFNDIAKGLAENGIATLRYNKRNFEHSEKYEQNSQALANLSINEETVDDAAHAYNYAKTLNKIDANNIFIAGISLGGMAVPRIAKQTDAAGYVMIAAPARGVEVLLAEQYDYIMNLDGKLSVEEQTAIDNLKIQTANLNRLSSENSFSNQDLPLGLTQTYWLDLKAYDVVAEAQAINAPLLIAQGGRDYQVLADKDFKIWQDTFGKVPNVTLKLFPNLNHLMHSGDKPSTPEEYFQPANVDNEFITTLSQWITAN